MADIVVRIKAVDEATAPMKKMGDETKSLGQQFAALTGTLDAVAGAFGIGLNIGSAIQMVKGMITNSYQLAAAMEQSQMAFSTMLGSGEAATKMLQDLRDFADKTPFEFVGLQDAAKRMMAYGFAAQDVIPMLTSVGDAAAALGGGQPMIERLTTALGQMSAKGKVSGEELRQLAEAGVPALRYLADSAGVTTGEMSKMIEQGIVPADKAVKVLLGNMTKDFGGLMGKQAETASGKMSTFNDAVSGLSTAIGERLIPVTKSAITFLTEYAVAAKEAVVSDNERRAQVDILQLALKNHLITLQDLQKATVYDPGYGFFGAMVKDQAAATELLEIATGRLALEQDGLNDKFTEAREDSKGLTDGLNDITQAAQDAKQAEKDLADQLAAMSFYTGALAGITSEYASDKEKLTDQHKKEQKALDDLEKSHRGQIEAILKGKGTVVDNTLELEKASIASEHLRIKIDELQVTYKNQEGIDKYREGVADLEEDQRKLSKSLADGKTEAEDYQGKLDKLNGRQNNLKEQLDKGTMSQEEYNLATRENNVALEEQARRFATLTEENGKGKTAQELANEAQAAYTRQHAALVTALDLTKQKELELQTQVKERILSSILMHQLEQLTKNGLTEEEIVNVQTMASEFGLAKDKEYIAALNNSIAATAFQVLETGESNEFISNAGEKGIAYKVLAGRVNEATEKGILIDLKGVREEVVKDTTEFEQLREVIEKVPKNVVIKILTVKQLVDMGKRQATLGERMGESSGPSQEMENVVSAIMESGRATGGPVLGGKPSLVGEYGPEIFVPAGAGNIKTNQFLNGLMGAAASGPASSMLNISTVNLYGVQNTSQLFEQLSREARARGVSFGKN